MSNVLKFEPRTKPEPRDPHMHGEALCTACRHKWIAVAQVGVQSLECPSCGCHRGYFRGFMQEPGSQVFTCNYCEGQLFEVRREFVMCVGCGFEHSWESLANA